MPIGIVDQLEVIDVQQQKRHWRAMQTGQFKLALRAFEKVPAVAALGEHVGGGQALQFAFELFLLGDVLGDAHYDQAMARVGLVADEAFIADPADFTVSTDDPVLAVFDGAFLDHLVQAALGVVQIIGIDTVAPLAKIRQQQTRRAAEDTLIGRADVDHALCGPVKGPQHSVDTHQQ